MTRRACTFRKADVKRAIQATEEAGAQVSRIEIDRAGRIIIFTGTAQQMDELDTELVAWGRRHGES